MGLAKLVGMVEPAGPPESIPAEGSQRKTYQQRNCRQEQKRVHSSSKMSGLDRRDAHRLLVKQSGIKRIERLQHGGQRIGRIGESGGVPAHSGNPAWIFGERAKRGSE